MAFTFIDLFAGIGGIRLAFEAAGGQCVFSSEWDAYAQRTYAANFGETPAGDITKIPLNDIPDHDVLVGGFPCQPFSIAGVSKLNALGRLSGFQNVDQGHLFFRVQAILASHRPRAFLLENVKNLRSHDGGRMQKRVHISVTRSVTYKGALYALFSASLGGLLAEDVGASEGS